MGVSRTLSNHSGYGQPHRSGSLGCFVFWVHGRAGGNGDTCKQTDRMYTARLNRRGGAVPHQAVSPPQTCQRDIKKLKANEMKLQQDMTSASREIARLRALVKDFGTELSAV